MLLTLNRRDAMTARLIGLALVAWSVIRSDEPLATHGRGLVVLVLLAVMVAAWLVWTFWTSRRELEVIFDLYVLAFSGGLLAVAAPSGAASVAVFVAAMSAGVRTDLRHGLFVVAVGVTGIGGGAIVYHFGALGVLAYTGGWCAMALAGTNIRQMRMRAEQAELLLAQTQRSHEEQLRATRLEEQTRIAREIHDVLAHSLAGLTIQLEATTALLDQGADPESIRTRVERAHQLAREGLRETRRAVGALREDAGATSAPVALALKALVDDYGAEVEAPVALTLDGAERQLHGQLGKTVLRVVQEALTNVRKHAPGAAVEVTVAVKASALTATVTDRVLAPVAAAPAATRTALATSGGRYGVRGMRERAQLLGGTLEAGPYEHGWRVELALPVDQQAAPSRPPASAPEGPR